MVRVPALCPVKHRLPPRVILPTSVVLEPLTRCPPPCNQVDNHPTRTPCHLRRSQASMMITVMSLGGRKYSAAEVDCRFESPRGTLGLSNMAATSCTWLYLGVVILYYRRIPHTPLVAELLPCEESLPTRINSAAGMSGDTITGYQRALSV